MTTLKVKVIRKPTIKVKVLPNFPSSVTVTSPILLSRVGGNYAFSFDVSALEITLGSVYQPFDLTLSALAALDSTAGLLTETALDTFARRTLTAPAAGITITNPAGTAGNPTFVLANDLAAVEGLASTGIARRTGTDAWSVGTAVTNAELSTMAAWTFKVNNTSGSATPTDITIDGLTVKTTPAAGDEVILWDVAGTAIKKATVSSLAAAAGVSSIAGNTGAFTLNSTSGLTNTVNDIKLQQATSAQFGAVKVDNTSIIATAGVISTVNPLPAPITASLGADVALNNTANYFDGPSIAQGSTGTWWVSGTVVVKDTAASAQFSVKLWDGTTVIASAFVNNGGTNFTAAVSLHGFIASPAGNLRISCKDITATTGVIVFNGSGNSKDSTISAHRII